MKQIWPETVELRKVVEEMEVVQMSVTEARALCEQLPEDNEFLTMLDNAQGSVYGGTEEESWLVIKIVR